MMKIRKEEEMNFANTIYTFKQDGWMCDSSVNCCFVFRVQVHVDYLELCLSVTFGYLLPFKQKMNETASAMRGNRETL